MRLTRIATLVAAGSAMLLTSGCAMTVDSFTLTDFRDNGFDLWVEQRTKREVVALMDDINDDYELWVVSKDHRVMCLGFATISSPSYYTSWIVHPNSEFRVFANRPREGGQFAVHSQAGDPSCSNWR